MEDVPEIISRISEVIEIEKIKTGEQTVNLNLLRKKTPDPVFIGVVFHLGKRTDIANFYYTDYEWMQYPISRGLNV